MNAEAVLAALGGIGLVLLNIFGKPIGDILIKEHWPRRRDIVIRSVSTLMLLGTTVFVAVLFWRNDEPMKARDLALAVVLGVTTTLTLVLRLLYSLLLSLRDFTSDPSTEKRGDLS